MSCCATAACIGLLILFIVSAVLKFLEKRRLVVRKDGPKRTTPKDWYDVIIVGAGPAGSTAAYFLAKQGKRVLLLEKKSFPRVKYCGDAWCTPALDILDEMGVLKQLEEAELCKKVQRGGFVSPFGYECVGGPYGSVTAVRTYAIKRVIADEYIARAAEQAGAELRENFEVQNISFDEKESCWSVEEDFKGRVLLIADGSTSYLGQKLGLVHGQSTACCTHQYCTNADFSADGVMFFSKGLLPGYSAAFKHYNDDVYLGTYILPGGRATSQILGKFEKSLLENYEPVKKIYGDSPEFRERAKTAPIRIGGIKKSYGDNLLILGDAAGQVDPLTGEGIHTAMVGSKIAANTLQEIFLKGDFSESNMSVYHHRWMKEFGTDFWWSAQAAKFMYYCPIVLDALCVVGERNGQDFLDFFGEIMTGVKPKRDFLFCKFTLPVGVELVKQCFLQYVLRKKPLVADCCAPIVDEMNTRAARKKQQ